MEKLTNDEKLELELYVEEIIHSEIQKIINQESKDIIKRLEKKIDLETNVDKLAERILCRSKIKGFVESIRI